MKLQMMMWNRYVLQTSFCKLITGRCEKKVGIITKIVDHASDIDRKHDITTDIKKKLKEKHPKAMELKQSAIIDKP